MSTIHDALKKVQRNFAGKETRDVLARKSGKKAADPSPPKPGTVPPFAPRPPSGSSAPAVSVEAPATPKPPVSAPIKIFKQKVVDLFEPSPGKKRDRTRQINMQLTFLSIAVCLVLIVSIAVLFRIFINAHADPQMAKESFVIKGIMAQGDQKVVLINDGIYEVGDVVEGMKILKIDTDSVQVKKGWWTRTYKITRPKPKPPPSAP